MSKWREAGAEHPVAVQAEGTAGPIEEAEGGNGVGLEGEEDGVEVVGL